MHPRVVKFLKSLPEEERVRMKKVLQNLKEDPFTPRPKVDIKKLKGKKHDLYRLRGGEIRFEYFVEEGVVWVDEAFKRGRGYK